MKKQIKIIGVPGSGKTHLLKQFTNKYNINFKIIDFGDEIKKNITPPITNNKVIALFQNILENSLPAIITTHFIVKTENKLKLEILPNTNNNCAAYIYVWARPKDILLFRKQDTKIREKYKNEKIIAIKRHLYLSFLFAYFFASLHNINFFLLKNTKRNIEKNTIYLKEIFSEFFGEDCCEEK